jgi:hypothetical protein
MLDWFYRLQPAPNLQPDWSQATQTVSKNTAVIFGTIRFKPFTDCFILIIIKRVLIERSLNVV